MLIEKIKTDMIAAKKVSDKLKANLLTTLYAEAVALGKNKGNRLPTDEETIAIAKKFVKNNVEYRNSLLKNLGLHENYVLDQIPNSLISDIEYNKILELKTEKQILESYLPQQLVREELEDIIGALHREGKNMAEIMRHLKENYTGLYDGKTASEISKSLQ